MVYIYSNAEWKKMGLIQYKLHLESAILDLCHVINGKLLHEHNLRSITENINIGLIIVWVNRLPKRPSYFGGIAQ